MIKAIEFLNGWLRDGEKGLSESRERLLRLEERVVEERKHISDVEQFQKELTAIRNLAVNKGGEESNG